MKDDEKKDENKEIREPFTPDDTPKPPQIIEPNSDRERENPVKNEDRPGERKKNRSDAATDKQHLMSEETDIEDETTI